MLDSNTVSSSHVGTTSYMAPEVFKGASYRRTAEVFSLGCVFSEIFTCMHGLSSHELSIYLKNKPFSQCVPNIIKWLCIIPKDNDLKQPNSLIYANEISEMLNKNPLNRPTLRGFMNSFVVYHLTIAVLKSCHTSSLHHLLPKSTQVMMVSNC